MFLQCSPITNTTDNMYRSFSNAEPTGKQAANTAAKSTSNTAATVVANTAINTTTKTSAKIVAFTAADRGRRGGRGGRGGLIVLFASCGVLTCTGHFQLFHFVVLYSYCFRLKRLLLFVRSQPSSSHFTCAERFAVLSVLPIMLQSAL